MKHLEDHPEIIDGCYPCKIGSVRFNGVYSLARMREAGVTGRQLGKENRENFKKERGYEPYSATERWI